jgi:bifunctional UDP-N-acetylglucosamine pyrophosphorylase / glucosamine-1-phosphate N-acetyltransferase
LSDAIETVAVVLAAGKGTRMKSDLPKVLIPVAGRPMIEYVLDALAAARIRDVLVVVGYRSDLVREQLGGRPGVSFVEQTEQLGTGHAVMVCRDELARRGRVAALVVTGDSPMMQPGSLATMAREFAKSRPACLIGTAHKENPQGLGRVIRDTSGDFLKIVEDKDATPDERRVTEVNMSCYLFDSVELLAALNKIKNNNAQREYYITDAPGVLKQEGKVVQALPVLQPIESLSINNVEELAEVERELLKRQPQRL